MTNYTRSWDDINELLLDDSDFGGQLNGGGFLKEAAEAIEATGADEMGKIALAYDHIQRHLKWNGEHALLVNENLRSAYDKRSGNSAEINLTLVVLLDRLGIVSDPVAISTRSHGRISPAQPTLSTFNYLLASATVNDQVILMDATDPKIPFGMLPERDLNGNGRLISKTRSGWVPLHTDRSDKSFWMYNLTLDDDLSLTGSVQASFDDYAAYRNRKAMETFGSDEDYIKAIQDNNPGLVVNTFEIINAEN